jgi:hypothetical protein
MQYDSVVKQPCTSVVEFVENAVENVRAYAETKAGNDAESLMDKRASYRLEELLRFLFTPGRVFRSASAARKSADQSDLLYSAQAPKLLSFGW